MDPTSLAIFLAVASQGSVTRAAAQLGRAPSNVTTRMQQLEAELGVTLFGRAGKRMRLTCAG
ncbi:helix-turn-helix domain-containing protein, partial [Escherichia coli]